MGKFPKPVWHVSKRTRLGLPPHVWHFQKSMLINDPSSKTWYSLVMLRHHLRTLTLYIYEHIPLSHTTSSAQERRIAWPKWSLVFEYMLQDNNTGLQDKLSLQKMCFFVWKKKHYIVIHLKLNINWTKMNSWSIS